MPRLEAILSQASAIDLPSIASLARSSNPSLSFLFSHFLSLLMPLTNLILSWVFFPYAYVFAFLSSNFLSFPYFSFCLWFIQDYGVSVLSTLIFVAVPPCFSFLLHRLSFSLCPVLTLRIYIYIFFISFPAFLIHFIILLLLTNPILSR